MTMSELWPLVVACAATIFGAGQLVEKIRNSRYVSKEVCNRIHERENERWQQIERTLERIEKKLDSDLESRK